jgi:hypothetical protein
MKNSIAAHVSAPSALESIDIEAIRQRRCVDADTLIRCVTIDVANKHPVLLPILLKYVPRNQRIGEADLEQLRSILKEGVLATIDDSPEIAITYLKALELCVAELHARS